MTPSIQDWSLIWPNIIPRATKFTFIENWVQKINDQ